MATRTLSILLLTTGVALADPVVIDGDTLTLQGERVRISNIDAPELRNPRCPGEAAAGLQAREALATMLAQGEPSLLREGTDRYGRTLAKVRVNGVDVGQALLKMGLALEWRPGRNAWLRRAKHWCPTYQGD